MIPISFLLELPFWFAFLFWSLMPSTQTTSFEIESIYLNSKDIVNIAVAGFYLFLPAINHRPLTEYRKPWHNYLHIVLIAVLVFAAISVEWNGQNIRDKMAMIYTLLLTASACLLGYNLIAKKSYESLRSFLWKLTVCIAAAGLLYSADSFLSLGMGSLSTEVSEDFGIQRVKGPLFVSTTGGFILLPALAFAIDELIKSATKSWFKLLIIFSLTLTLIGLGSRSVLIVLGIFIILLLLTIKNKKHVGNAFLSMIILAVTAVILFFSRAKTDRLQSFEDSSRSDTYLTSLKMLEYRIREDINTLVFGSGYGSYWSWYTFDTDTNDETHEFFNMLLTQYGHILYHPHSTLLICLVELGIPGIIFFTILWIVLFRLVLRNLQNAPFPFFSCGVFASAFLMFFDFFIFRSTQINSLWWVFLFGALALNTDFKNIDKPSINNYRNHKYNHISQ